MPAKKIPIGELTTTLARAAIAGTGFPENVPHTDQHQQLFDQLEREVTEIKQGGKIPYVPPDWTEYDER